MINGPNQAEMCSAKLIPQNSYQFNWKEFACGWGAAFINVTVTYPINKLIFRQVHI